jgi:hypothetical protein
MRAEAWQPVDGISGPCDTIAFSYGPPQRATVVMSFTDSKGANVRELVLKFKELVVLTGEDEAPGGFVQTPDLGSLPKLPRDVEVAWDRPAYTFPLMRLFDSKPLRQYQMMRPPDPPLAHFFLVSFDNLVHVIASSEVEARWNTQL